MDNNLAIKNPELAKQWHETKNRPFFMLHLVPIKKHGGNVKELEN
ncbi:hypothetical protein PDK32_23560 [Bacillus cereus]|nr:hypothetical protein [Bacillus cereus]